MGLESRLRRSRRQHSQSGLSPYLLILACPSDTGSHAHASTARLPVPSGTFKNIIKKRVHERKSEFITNLLWHRIYRRASQDVLRVRLQTSFISSSFVFISGSSITASSIRLKISPMCGPGLTPAAMRSPPLTFSALILYASPRSSIR